MQGAWYAALPGREPAATFKILHLSKGAKEVGSPCAPHLCTPLRAEMITQVPPPGSMPEAGDQDARGQGGSVVIRVWICPSQCQLKVEMTGYTQQLPLNSTSKARLILAGF